MKDLSTISYFQSNNVNTSYLFDHMTGFLTKENTLNYIANLVQTNTPFSLMFIDMDNFKFVNDTMGHRVGDLVIKDLTTELNTAIGQSGVLGRFGGDEFIAVCENIVDYDSVWNICKTLVTHVRKKRMSYLAPLIPAEGVSVTIGCASFPTDGKTVDDIFNLADKALYKGKQKGKNCFIIYKEDIHGKYSPNEALTAGGNEKKLDFVLNAFAVNTPNVALRNIAETVGKEFFIDSISLCQNDKFDVLYSSNLTLPDYIPITEFGQFGDSKIISFHYRTNIAQSNPSLFSRLVEQDIRAMIIAKISEENGNCSYIRVDSRRERVWGADEKNIFILAASIYKMLIEKNN